MRFDGSGTLYGVYTLVTRESVSSGATACSRADLNASSVATSVSLPRSRVISELAEVAWFERISCWMSLDALPDGRSAPKFPLPARFPPVKSPPIDRPSRTAEKTSIHQRVRYAKRPQRANMEGVNHTGRS